MTIRLKRQRLKYVIACGSGPKFLAQDTARVKRLTVGMKDLKRTAYMLSPMQLITLPTCSRLQ